MAKYFCNVIKKNYKLIFWRTITCFVKIVLTVANSTARFEKLVALKIHSIYTIAIYILKILKEHFVKANLENSFWLIIPLKVGIIEIFE